jgi:phosphatidylinositol glycan class B
VKRFVRAHLAVTLVLVIVTAWGSYAYFHIDENFQVLQFTWWKLGRVEAWTLPWEHASKMRAYMQPFLYVVLARVLGVFGVQDVFSLAFAFRLATGLASFGSLALFIQTALPWMRTDDEKRMFVRVATLLGFLPYLFVRTSSETLAMASFTAAFAIALDGAAPAGSQSSSRWVVTSQPWRLVVSGLLLGLAFEARFQSIFLSAGLLVWLAVVARMPWRALATMKAAALAVVVLAAPIDRWGYGEWTFPPLAYARVNLLEGAAQFFGADPPFAYAWMLPSNFFFPIVVLLLVTSVLAWFRNPRHPLTWTAVPFFLVHNLLSHKEERFLFPLAILATALVPLGIGPSAAKPDRARKVAAFLWAQRARLPAKILAGWSCAFMFLLAIYPVGWHHHVRFQRHVHDAVGDELRANALPDFDLGLPAFHGRVYDVEKLAPDELAHRIESGTARAWLVADTPQLHTGVAGIDTHVRLVWSELPFWDHPSIAGPLFAIAEAYNAHERPPLRPLRYRSLYAIEPLTGAR